jgi:hypothetical protein
MDEDHETDYDYLLYGYSKIVPEPVGEQQRDRVGLQSPTAVPGHRSDPIKDVERYYQDDGGRPQKLDGAAEKITGTV